MDYSKLPTEGRDMSAPGLDELDAIGIAGAMSEALKSVYRAVDGAKEQTAKAIEAAAGSIRKGGRVIYCGCGTSGRIAVLDASECGPTFSDDRTFIGLIAGGDGALRHSIEGAEDDFSAGEAAIAALDADDKDTVVAVSASGTAKWCLGAVSEAKKRGCATFALCCCADSPLYKAADHAIVTETGNEPLAGSTRLKAATAAKTVLNSISTGAYALTGRVYKNLMVDVRASNSKLNDRRVRIVMAASGIGRSEAEASLERAGGDVKLAIVMNETMADIERARAALGEAGGSVRGAVALLKKEK